MNIPFAALEAGARAICAGNKWGEPCATPCSDCLPEARAAFLAMIEAWPGVRVDDTYRWLSNAVIILPMEDKNAES